LRYVTLLKQNNFAAKIAAVQAVTYLGVWFSHVAIFSLMLALDADPWKVSLLAFCMFVPAVIQSPFTGVLADKLPLKKLMLTLISVEILTTIGFSFVTTKDELWLFFVLIIIRMSASSFYFTCKMSLLPRVLSGEELKVANELHSIIWSTSYTIGMALSGLAVNYLGVKTAFYIDVILFVGAFAIFSTIRFDDRPTDGDSKFASMLAEGFSYLKTNPKILFLMFLHATVAFTAFDALVALLAEQEYKMVIAVPLAIGFVNAVRSVALIVGAGFFGKFVNRKSVSYLFLAQGLSIIVWGFMSHSFYLSLIGSFLTGLFTTTLWSYTMTMIQEECDERYYGRVIALNDMVFNLFAGLTSLLIGALASAGVGGLGALTALGAAFFVTAGLYQVWLVRYQDKTSCKNNVVRS
jgi:MFS transporter, DHA3 family, macrolide efflux protein